MLRCARNTFVAGNRRVFRKKKIYIDSKRIEAVMRNVIYERPVIKYRFFVFLLEKPLRYRCLPVFRS